MGAPNRSQSRGRQETGEIFGRYRLLGLIAQGGMATVHRARMECPGGVRRAVAIKRMLPHISDRDDVREMFEDEARIALRLGHPNLCSALDFGEVEGEPYLALEFLDGKPVGEVASRIAESLQLRASPEWHAMAARVMAEACEGLHHAHTAVDDDGRALRVVHRDVSPANVVIGFDGCVKVVDFGIARFVDRLHETRCGAIKGKMEYMAPEQLMGGAVDARTDVFALGVTLWTMLAGCDPSDAVGTVAAMSSQPIPAPSTVRPGVPKALDEICLRAMRRDPSLRYPSARAMGRELHAYLRSQRFATEICDRSDWLAGLFAKERSGRIELAKTALASQDDQAAEDVASAFHAGPTRIITREQKTNLERVLRAPAAAAPPPAVPGAMLAVPAGSPSPSASAMLRITTMSPAEIVEWVRYQIALAARHASFTRVVALIATGIVLVEILAALLYVAAG